MPKIINCTKNASGTYIPRRVHTQRGQIITRAVHNKRTVHDNVNDFIEGVDAGMDILEHFINRITRLGAK